MWNPFNGNNEDTLTMSMTLFQRVFCYLQTDFTHFSGFSIVDFEQVNAGRKKNLFKHKFPNMFANYSHLSEIIPESCLDSLVMSLLSITFCLKWYFTWYLKYSMLYFRCSKWGLLLSRWRWSVNPKAIWRTVPHQLLGF